MVTNPDQSRRKDSLRQFVVTLFERKELKQLAFYPYVDMFEDLENIIESRARSVDLSVNNYYDFLYSFHISKENYRKAAYVMYECAMRLSTETFSQQGLEKQVQCFLACLNSLRLVNPNYAWIGKKLRVKQYISTGSSIILVYLPGLIKYFALFSHTHSQTSIESVSFFYINGKFTSRSQSQALLRWRNDYSSFIKAQDGRVGSCGYPKRASTCFGSLKIGQLLFQKIVEEIRTPRIRCH